MHHTQTKSHGKMSGRAVNEENGWPAVCTDSSVAVIQCDGKPVGEFKNNQKKKKANKRLNFTVSVLNGFYMNVKPDGENIVLFFSCTNVH